MSVGTTAAAALGVGAAASAAGSLGSAAMESSAAGNAATAQTNAADYAANLQHQDSQDALNFNKQEWNQQQANEAPWLTAGQNRSRGTWQGLHERRPAKVCSRRSRSSSKPNRGDGAERSRLPVQISQQGMPQLQNASAAKGSLLSGNGQQAEQNYGQNYASERIRERLQPSNAAVHRTPFNIFSSNKSNEYNRLAGLAGTGQQAATTYRARSD